MEFLTKWGQEPAIPRFLTPVSSDQERVSPQESPAIPKRIPPSQRPERQLDATARAIASARETEAPDKKTDAVDRPRDLTKPRLSHAGKSGGRPAPSSGPAPSPSTKRPKHPGD